MTGSQGLGRRRPPLLALVPWTRQFGLGALGQDAGKTMADELYHGGWPLRPVQIPMSWLRPPAVYRQDPPFARAEVTQAGGATARSSNPGAAINGREWVFSDTIDSVVDVDPTNLAACVTAYYTDPLPRTPGFTLVLNSRAPTEIWRILGVTQGTPISITGAPDATLLLAADAFGRSVSSTWDVADTLQPWTTSGGSASDHSVSGGAGLQSLGTVNVMRSATLDVGATDMTVTVTVSLPVNSAASASITQWICSRLVDASNYYTARLDLSTAGNVTLNVFKRVAGTLSGSLLPGVIVGTGHTAGDRWTVTLDILRSRIRAKAWLTTEPDWQLEVTDTEPALATATGIGLLSRLEAGNTNTLPVVASWGPLSVTTPNPRAWPDGATELVVEGIGHQVRADLRTVLWRCAPIAGAVAGIPGPWFYSDSSQSSGSDAVPF